MVEETPWPRCDLGALDGIVGTLPGKLDGEGGAHTLMLQGSVLGSAYQKVPRHSSGSWPQTCKSTSRREHVIRTK